MTDEVSEYGQKPVAVDLQRVKAEDVPGLMELVGAAASESASVRIRFEGVGADRVFVALGETPDAETKAKIESGEWGCVGATMGGTFPSDSMPAGVWYGPKKPVS
ncbi:hypothetical protein ACVIRO_002318 [Rhizobium ruizarguesonis]